MKKWMFLLIACPIVCLSQTNKPVTDSAKYYMKELTNLEKQLHDSMRQSERYVELLSAYKRTVRGSRNYGGPVLFGSVLHSDYAAFDESIAQSGFPAMNDITGGLGFGFSGKGSFVIIDFYFMSAHFDNTSKKGDERIGSSLANIFQFDMGFDILSSQRMSFYPFGGLSLRMASLNYTKEGTVNSGFTNITNIVSNANEIYATSSRLGYQAGLGLDVFISNNKEHTAGTVLFAKAGINKPFGKDTYKIEGVKYDPQIKKGDWGVTFGFKFVKRN